MTGNPSREAVFQALAARMDLVLWRRAGGTVDLSFVTKSRRLKLFSDVSTEQQPACFQAEHDEIAKQVTNLPYRWIWQANWVIYQNTAKDKKVAGAIENNLIIDAVELALAPRPADVGFLDQRCTLGNLIHHCFIDGRVFKDPGDVDDQAMIVVPIKLLIP